MHIQRASAGSGKTYTLARNFIFNLIAAQEESGNWRLRGNREIEDTLSRILAITFTNKATNEMKERIIEKLSQLSKASDTKNLTPEFISQTDYLKYIAGLTGETYEEVGKKSRKALNTILNNYSLFHISTIDSFFQEILRTFAYEANINESYQLELDSKYIVTSAVDASLEELETRKREKNDIRYWLEILMDEESQKSQRWNVFSKSESQYSVYSGIREALYKLENEEYKIIKEELEEFFADPKSSDILKSLYIWLKRKANEEREKLINEIKDLKTKTLEEISKKGISNEILVSYFLNQLPKIDSLSIDKKVDFSFSSIINKGTIFKANKRKPEYEQADDFAIKMYERILKLDTPSPESYQTICLVYRPLIPFLGLIMELRKKMMELLENETFIKISDTSFILKRIIGEEDAPFIYERLGTTIDNYLIDEFQDTSQMQWDVLKPLLAEAEAKGQDSLIIGDPKQSIYRFRNANHKLITDIVPSEFPNHIAAGNKKEENTNWRSKKNIVEFNNYFFKRFAESLSELSRDLGADSNFQNLYSNVVQYPKHQNEEGYIEIRFFKKNNDESEEENWDDDLKENWFNKTALSKIGPLISNLVKRGYKQRDISILVNTNALGNKVIEALIKYNETLSEGEQKIDFISEESLYVSSSSSVEIIISVLGKIADSGMFLKKNLPENNVGDKCEDEKKYKTVSWNKVKFNYYFYSLMNPELKKGEKIISFLNDTSTESFLREMIINMELPTLSGLVETIVEHFIDPLERDSEAIYISALQDAVNEYSQGHSNDPASFLEWWDKKSKKLSVSSPEGIDAVQVMTIHKSKGLEFKCVIIPFAVGSLRPNSKDKKKIEWRWVKPQIDKKEHPSPPFLPIQTIENLKGSKHQDIYIKYIDQILTDKLNAYYVAFTRAKNELYIFTSHATDKKPDISYYLKNICEEIESNLLRYSQKEKELMIESSFLEWDENKTSVSIGKKMSEGLIKKEYEKETTENESVSKTIEGYYVNKKRPRLFYKATEGNSFAEFSANN